MLRFGVRVDSRISLFLRFVDSRCFTLFWKKHGKKNKLEWCKKMAGPMWICTAQGLQPWGGLCLLGKLEGSHMGVAQN